MPHSKSSNKTALMLTGGGARAAYQVGVLKALARSYSRRHPLPFSIVCGTSAGSINSAALACYSSCFHLGAKKLEWVWKHFHTNQVYHSDTRRVFEHMVRRLLSLAKSDFADQKPASLLDSAPLRQLLREVIDFRRIDRNIQRKTLDALSITTSCYSDGDSISFYQGKEDIHNWYRARRKGLRTQITTEHLMASAAIPLVFPSVKVQQSYYGDGSVHQLAPLSPAVHLGAEKIFIIGVDRTGHEKYTVPETHHPSAATIATHLFDTIFTDTLNADIERLQRINRTLELMTQEQQQVHHLRPIGCYVIQPSQDIDIIAKEFYNDLPFAIRMLLRTVGVDQNSESSLTSYLLFEKSYTKRLIQVGYEDGKRHLDEIRAFLDD